VSPRDPEDGGGRRLSSPTEGGVRSSSRPGPVATTDLRLAVVSDATPGRNGVGTYYDDLVELLGTSSSPGSPPSGAG